MDYANTQLVAGSTAVLDPIRGKAECDMRIIKILPLGVKID